MIHKFNEIFEKINWQGLIFNNCEILSPELSYKNSSGDLWNVKCHCGKIFKTRPNDLKRNKSKSCGCLSKIHGYKRGKLNKKYIYLGYINDFGIKIIKPLIEGKEGPKDYWIALCPNHNPPLEFTTKPNNVITNGTKSCGCLKTKINTKRIIEFNKKRRVEKGFKEDEFLIDINTLFRTMLFDPIKKIIIKLDCSTCALCLKKKRNIEVHHIEPINLCLNLLKKEKIFKIYDFKNLISLCVDCHLELAHNGKPFASINEDVKNELLIITSMRPINNEIKKEYDFIVNNTIEPWLNKYLKERNLMEKSAEFQTKVFKQDGKLLMRLPGGEEVPYDHRFGNLEELLVLEGDYQIFPVED